MKVVMLCMLALSWALTDGAVAATPDSKRVALVIGNSNYAHTVVLPNPAVDARLMTDTLKKAGFEVIEGIDLTYAEMRASLNRFTEASDGADIALIYYAGHGMQVDAKNYLIPVDAELTVPAHLRTRTIEIDEMLDALPPDPAVGIVILDACRNNPLSRTMVTSLQKTRSTVEPGLAPVTIEAGGIGTGGILIAYATDPGAVAYDGKDVNSPYTRALAKHLAEPGVEIQSALTRVRGEVAAETGGRQRPWHNASMGREVYIGGAPETLIVGEGASAKQSEADHKALQWEIEQRVWDQATKRDTIDYYEAYLQQFPKGNFVAIARLNIKALTQSSVVPPATTPEPIAPAEPAVNESSVGAAGTPSAPTDIVPLKPQEAVEPEAAPEEKIASSDPNGKASGVAGETLPNPIAAAPLQPQPAVEVEAVPEAKIASSDLTGEDSPAKDFVAGVERKLPEADVIVPLTPQPAIVPDVASEEKTALLDPALADAPAAAAEPAIPAAKQGGTDVTEAALNLTPDDRRDLQSRLMALGFDIATADGIFGPGTRRAIRAWQQENDLPESGYLSVGQREQLVLASDPQMEEFRQKQARERENATNVVKPVKKAEPKITRNPQKKQAAVPRDKPRKKPIQTTKAPSPPRVVTIEPEVKRPPPPKRSVKKTKVCETLRSTTDGC